jgi:hypothetical protein
MKKYLLFLSLIVIASQIHSQPSIKVFGFEQESTPGTVAANVKDENGKPIKKVATQKNYLIYLSLAPNHAVNAQHVFINGEAFPVESSTTETTPVQHVDNNIPDKPEYSTLVPRTSNKVIRLIITNPTQVEKTASIQKLTTKNDVVVSYTWKEKKYFAVLKKLKKLDPVLNQ